jgi:hypothetical protein
MQLELFEQPVTSTEFLSGLLADRSLYFQLAEVQRRPAVRSVEWTPAVSVGGAELGEFELAREVGSCSKPAQRPPTILYIQIGTHHLSFLPCVMVTRYQGAVTARSTGRNDRVNSAAAAGTFFRLTRRGDLNIDCS